MANIKTYTIRQIEKDGKILFQRENEGFNLFELIGILEHTQLDLMERFAKGIEPDKIETKAIVDKPSEN